MNGNDILRAMNELDERFVISANRERTIKHSSKKILQKTAVGIAAALALAIPAGAVYTQFEHKAAVQEYFDDKTADYLEDKGLALNYVSENEHLRITVDTLLSDGNIGSILLTVDGLDSDGINYVENTPFFDMYITEKKEDVSNSEKIFLEGGGSISPDVCNGTQYSLQKELFVCDIDIEKDFVLTFEDRKKDGDLFDGISFDISFRPNLETKKFEDKYGRLLWFSQIGYYTNEEETTRMLSNWSVTSENMRIFRKNSILSDNIELSSQTYDRRLERKKPMGCGWFFSIVEISEYNEVKIGDILFREVK
jgi:hypothetical protein